MTTVADMIKFLSQFPQDTKVTVVNVERERGDHFPRTGKVDTTTEVNPSFPVYEWQNRGFEYDPEEGIIQMGQIE
jgi:hypothetical protein